MEESIAYMLNELNNKRYGKYRGVVKRNDDPSRIGRLQVSVPSLSGQDGHTWALPCLPFGGCKQGMFFVPEVGAQVWIEFEEGDTSRPIWTGVFWDSANDLPDEADKATPTTRILQTTSGHKLQFDDHDGERRVRLTHATESELLITDDGSIHLTNCAGMTLNLNQERGELLLEDAKGNMLRMNNSGWSAEDISGNRIEMSGGTVTINANGAVMVDGLTIGLGSLGGEQLIKGNSFMTMYSQHIHTGAPVVGGPTSKPIPQGEWETLSMKVFTG